MEERTTKEVIQKLGDDYRKCCQLSLDAIDDDGKISPENEFPVRQLVRAAFAYIEAVTYSAKLTAAEKCLDDGIPISMPERYYATETKYELSEKGEVIEKSAQIRMAQNLRFTFNLLARAYNKDLFDPSQAWWSSLKSAIKIRDRLTHPRSPEDLDISTNELATVIKATNGFEDLLMRYK